MARALNTLETHARIGEIRQQTTFTINDIIDLIRLKYSLSGFAPEDETIYQIALTVFRALPKA